MPSQNSGAARVVSTTGIVDALDPGAALPGEIGADQHAEERRRRAGRSKVRISVFGRTDSTMLEHRLAAVEGDAELALHEVAEIDHVLLPQRPIEAELAQDQVLLLRASAPR